MAGKRDPSQSALAALRKRRADERELLPVVGRALALCAIARRAHGVKRAAIGRSLCAGRVHVLFTPAEKAFWTAVSPPFSVRCRFSYGVECAYVLAWAMGLQPKLGAPDRLRTPTRLIKAFESGGSSAALAKSTPRSDAEVRSALERIERCHWRIRDARLHQRPVSKGLNPDVVDRWHHALVWLTDKDVGWDDVTTDT